MDGSSLLFTMTDEGVVEQLSYGLSTAEMDEFIHAVVTIDLGSIGTMTGLGLYVNGTLVDSGSTTAFNSWSGSWSNMGLGGYNAPGYSVGGNRDNILDDFGYFNGEIAAFRLYER